ncbi:uncharacterized protein MYCFIDRAFT_198573 [Pseudocercospora fijiensis CIRAD86]|uniref:Uncharacterized protein n=1 Tax=Pseudocercospora fijiensis (strain CIRAD86) TaxID=383855 RepID=M3AS59_PSEFD|nr:uncharacterized protein MYCFIDRAFT_198573 [Pseudocercospora fijiensis CIRAD86]EME80312.1 hypothetical protein MYCFIDRAFT_198573 [Pseudocercospora fijiensis CIRAD86]
MYRASDPRFRRRLNDITQTLESANESAQSGIYIFGQNYVKPCFQSIASCFTSCVDASCPALNVSQRDRLRRQRGRGRSRGRAELSFDFYDDWDDDDNDALLGWGNDEFDRLVGAGGSAPSYGTVSAQPGRQRGMSYPKSRRKSAAALGEEDPTVIPGSSSFWRRMFGGKSMRYKPSAADLQEHPGARKTRARDLTEGERLLEEDEELFGGRGKGRARSGTQGSRDTTGSYSSRGDIFPSDEEDDAIPLDDEFAMVLERRTTFSGPDTESSSGKTGIAKRGKRPSAGSRASTRRTFSSQSTRSETGSGRRKRRSTRSSISHTPTSEARVGGTEDVSHMQGSTTSLADLKRQEAQMAQEEEEDIERRRQTAQRIAAERGLVGEDLSSKEATPRSTTPAPIPEEPSQLPTPLPTDDEDDVSRQEQEMAASNQGDRPAW